MEQENVISPKIVQWFESRGINQEVVKRMGVYSGQHLDTGVKPDPNGNIIVFPYLRAGSPVNAKYRAQGKRFYQQTSGTPCFWNSDILSDPALIEGRSALVIVEGEMDALSVLQAGYPFVVSVPNGAPPPLPEGVSPGDIDDDDDRFKYVMIDWDRLKKIKRIIIASDNDASGKRLAEELVRRLGRVRCGFVVYPDDCKDFNEVLVTHGGSAITAIIAGARPYPLSGVYTLSQLPAEPPLEPVSTGWGRIDSFMMPFYPAFMVVTGVANSGKSTWTNQLVAQLSYKHGWKVGIASFEMRIRPFVTDTLAAVKRERNPGCDDLDIDRWIDKNFVFICPEPSGDDDKIYDADWLIERAIEAVVRYGIRVLLIDPWNEIEHSPKRRELGTDYVGRTIQKLKRFGREFECLVIVVAHPTKSGADKKPQDIGLYDISDSAHFANKADFGVVIHRITTDEGQLTDMSNVMIKKIRYQPVSGQIGSVELVYDRDNRTFGQ